MLFKAIFTTLWIGCLVLLGLLTFGTAEEGNFDIEKLNAPKAVTFIWHLNGRELEEEPGKYRLSPKFTTWNQSEQEIWQLQIYPHGFDQTTSGWLSLFLIHRGNKPVTAKFTLFVMDRYQNKPEHIMELNKTFEFDMHGWGSTKYILRKLVDVTSIGVQIESHPFLLERDFRIPRTVAFTWEVELEQLLAVKARNYLLSPKFNTWNQSTEEVWQIQVYPKGFKNMNLSEVGLYLVHRGDKQVNTEFALHIFNENECDGITLESENTFKNDFHGWGSNKMVDAALLTDPDAGFLTDNKIRFGVLIPTDPIAVEKSPPRNVPYIWKVTMEDMNLTTGNYLLSPKLSTWKGTEEDIWQLQLYPKGFQSDETQYIALFLVHRGNNSVSVAPDIFILNKEMHKTVTKTVSTKNYTYDLQGWGSRTFIERATLLDPTKGFLINDEIRIGVKIPTDYITLMMNGDCSQNVGDLTVIKSELACEDVELRSLRLSETSDDSTLAGSEPLKPPDATPQINATLQNLYREVKIKVGNAEISISHVMSFESIERLMASLMMLSSNSSNFNPAAG